MARGGRFSSRTLRGAAALAVVLALAAGCSGGSGTSGGSAGAAAEGGAPGTVSAALSRMPSTAWDTTYVEFGQVATVLGINGGTSGTGPAEEYLGVGDSSLAATGVTASVLGFDPLKVTAAVSVGMLPAQTTALYGTFDASAIGKKLTGDGFKQKGAAGGGTLYALAADNQISVNNPTGDPQFNVVDVSAGRIVYGGSTANVDALAAFTGNAPLSSNTDISALASCLGDSKAAEITQLTQSAGSPLVGVGLTGGSSSDLGEEICVLAKDSATANAIGAGFAQKIRSGRSIRANEPWSQLLADPQSSVVSSSPAVVRLSAKPAAGGRAGILLRTYMDSPSDFSALITP